MTPLLKRLVLFVGLALSIVGALYLLSSLGSKDAAVGDGTKPVEKDQHSSGTRWTGVFASERPDQERAIALIKELDGKITYDEHAPSKQVKGITLVGNRVADDHLAALQALSKLEDIQLFKTSVTDAGLRHLAAFRELNFVTILGANAITDDGLAQLEKHASLTGLILQHARLSDVGLKHLANLKQLKTLVLDGVGVSDAGLKHLEDLHNLEFLSLYNNRISDKGLPSLKNLVRLKTLNLGSTSVTGSGFDCLLPLKQLEVLVLTNTRVSDQEVEVLGRLTNLKQLGIKRTNVSDDGAKKLAKSLAETDITR